MVSLKLILYNILQLRRFPRWCTVKIGKHLHGAIPYIISSEPTDKVVIGKYCSIARGVILIPHPGHIPPKEYSDYRVSTYPLFFLLKQGFPSRYFLPEKRNFIIIGNDVWIGANVIILPGVTVGDGAIIGSSSVVTNDVPPYAVAFGVPANIQRYRYSQEQIKKLLEIAWWDWDDKKIRENMDHFYGKIDDFIERFYGEIRTKRPETPE